MEGVAGNVQPSPCTNVSSVRNILPQAAMHNFYHANPMSCLLSRMARKCDDALFRTH